MLSALRQTTQVLALVVKQHTGRAAVGLLLAAVVLSLWRPGPLEPGIGYAGGEAICGGGIPPSQFLSAQGSEVAGSLFQTNPATGASAPIGPVVTTGGQPLSITGLAQQLSTSTATPGTLYGATAAAGPTNGSSLVTINPATGQATVIGQFHTATGGVRTMADLVIAPPNSPCAGTLLGMGGGDRTLYSIDPMTALVTPRGAPLPTPTQGNGLTFDAAGNLWRASLDTFSLLRIDCATGAVLQSVSLTGTNGNAIKALAGAADGTLLGARGVNFGAGAADLISINPATGAITSLGTLPANTDAVTFLCPALGTPTPTCTPVGTPTPSLGDFNRDGFIDIRDYGVWRQNFGQTNCGNPADADGNCLVDIGDYGIWRQHFGEGTPPDRRGRASRAGIAPALQGTPGTAHQAGDRIAAGSRAVPPGDGPGTSVPMIPVVGGLLGLGGLAGWRRRN